MTESNYSPTKKTDGITPSAHLISVSEQVAASTSGVLRVEPSLQRLVADLGAGIAEKLGLSYSAQNKLKNGGIRVTLSGNTASVSIDIATDTNRPAVPVAQMLQERIFGAIATEGYACGKIDINILAIEGR